MMIFKRRRIQSCAKSKALFLLSLLITAGTLFAEDAQKLDNLLAGYLKNDLELQKCVLTAQSKQIALNSSKIQNGISVELSTGQMQIQSSADKTKISVKPQATVSVPKANGLELTASVPVTVEDGQKSVSNGSIGLSAEIIGSSRDKAKLSEIQAERALTQAERAVRDRALTAEKEFYEELKTLYNYAIKISSLKNDLYDDQLDLKVLETQGYSKTSAKYRQAYLQVQSDERDIMEQQRIFERQTAVFAKKCGFEYSRGSSYGGKTGDSNQDGEIAYTSSMEFLPSSIPEVSEVNIFDFDSSTYSKIESASWDKYIGNLQRKSNSDSYLKAGVGYIINNDFLADDNSSSKSDSVEGTLSWNWGGLTASAGVGLPTGSSIAGDNSIDTISKTFNPYYTLSFAINPGDFLVSKNDREQDKIDSKIEDIALKSAQDDWETEILERTNEYHDLKWAQNSYAEEYKLYTQLESDMKKWLAQGNVTESDYLDALNNKEKARLNIMINSIEQIIYNNEVKLLFTADSSKKGEN
jgi:hypothetical protein